MANSRIFFTSDTHFGHKNINNGSNSFYNAFWNIYGFRHV